MEPLGMGLPVTVEVECPLWEEIHCDAEIDFFRSRGLGTGRGGDRGDGVELGWCTSLDSNSRRRSLVDRIGGGDSSATSIGGWKEWRGGL